jgi:hypothetical protein
VAVVLPASVAKAVEGGREVGGGLDEVAIGAALDGEEVDAAEGCLRAGGDAP